MKYAEITVLNHKSIIDQVLYLPYCFLSPDTPDINFRFEIQLSDQKCRISLPVSLARFEALLSSPGYPFNFIG
jgi:hypothetical protein